MRTDFLIQALAADSAIAIPSLQRRFYALLALSIITAAFAFWVLLGPRDNALSSLGNVRFLFKFVVTLSLAIPMTGLVLRMARPGATLLFWRRAALAAPALLIFAVILELTVLPANAWRHAAVGQNALDCLVFVPLIGLTPLGLLLLALRHGAPEKASQAGAAAGIAAGAIAASFYAMHCPDDSPLFLAVWYSISILILSLIGRAIGSRVLQW